MTSREAPAGTAAGGGPGGAGEPAGAAAACLGDHEGEGLAGPLGGVGAGATSALEAAIAREEARKERLTNALPGARAAVASGARKELRARMLNFMKECYLKGELELVRTMFQDTSESGRAPRQFGEYGFLTYQDLCAVNVAFEAWIKYGRIGMPAYYHSPTYKTNLSCFVLRQHQDGCLDLGETAAAGRETEQGITKRKAGPQSVRVRPLPGWFAPSRAAAGARVATSGASAAGGGAGAELRTPSSRTPGAEPVSSPSPAAAAAVPAAAAVGTVAAAAATSAAASASPAAEAATAPPPSHATPAPSVGELYVVHRFDGLAYGPEYLVLNPGDTLQWDAQEQAGWRYGTVVGRVGGAAAVPGPAAGWYPAVGFAEPRPR